jgi:hypothetical protein
MLLGEHRGHALAGIQAVARHRHQNLHRQVRADLAFAHLLLDGLRQQFHQRQTPRHPTHAAIEAARQLVQPVVKAPLHLRQQPTLFQRSLRLAEAQRTIQQQSLGFAHRPDHGFHRIAAQLLQGGDAFVAVDHQVAVRLAGGGDHHDGRLLAYVGQRGQESPLPLRTAHPQMLPAPIQLVKLQLHGLRSRDSVWSRRDLVFRGRGGKCAGNPIGVKPIHAPLVFRGAQD